jgi:hypothetical protein
METIRPGENDSATAGDHKRPSSWIERDHKTSDEVNGLRKNCCQIVNARDDITILSNSGLVWCHRMYSSLVGCIDFYLRSHVVACTI